VPSCRKGTGWSENPRPRSCGARVLVSISISIASASPTPIGVREASVEGRRREKRFSASSTDICRGVMVPIEVSCAILVVATAQTSQRTREEVHGGLAEDPHFRRGRTKGTCGVGSRIGDGCRLAHTVHTDGRTRSTSATSTPRAWRRRRSAWSTRFLVRDRDTEDVPCYPRCPPVLRRRPTHRTRSTSARRHETSLVCDERSR
jgi:hypothetical protein